MYEKKTNKRLTERKKSKPVEVETEENQKAWRGRDGS